MQCDNTLKDPFLAMQALMDIDQTVKIFVEESTEGVLSEEAIDFLHDLRQFCRRVYYKEPSEIEKAKAMIKEESNDA